MCNPVETSFLQSNWVGLLTIFIGAVFVVWQTRYTIHKQNQWALAKQRYAIYRKAHDLYVYYAAKELQEDARKATPLPENLDFDMSPRHDEFGVAYDPTDVRLAILPLLALPTKMSGDEKKSIRELITNSGNLKGAEKFMNEMLRKLDTELVDEDEEMVLNNPHN